MVDTLMNRLVATKAAQKKTKKDKWLREYPGQLCIVASQIQWTSDTERALKHVRIRGDKKALRTMKKKQVTFCQKMEGWVGGRGFIGIPEHEKKTCKRALYE